MTCVVSTKSNAPFKRYVRVTTRKIGLVTDVRDATRLNHRQLIMVLGRVHSILPSCYFEYEELVVKIKRKSPEHPQQFQGVLRLAEGSKRLILSTSSTSRPWRAQSSAFSGHDSATLPERAEPGESGSKDHCALQL
jgi:hypothetical protein